MIGLYSTLIVLCATGAAEWLHARRVRRVARLAYPVRGAVAARGWTRAVPVLVVLGPYRLRLGPGDDVGTEARGGRGR